MSAPYILRGILSVPRYAQRHIPSWRGESPRKFSLVAQLLENSSKYLQPCVLCGHQGNLRLLTTTTPVFKKRKTAEERKNKKAMVFSPKSFYKSDKIISIWKGMTVEELAEAADVTVDDIFEAILFVEGAEKYEHSTSIIDNVYMSQNIIKKLGMRMKLIAAPAEPQELKVKDVKRRPPPDPSVLVPRPPVVTIMGHVDHGKTTLLDTLRNTNVVDSEFGGITQHIGAFSVNLEGTGLITFLDTPGHAAFSAMRARGAHVTDIIVLVVAADDGVMQQTIESINLAKEANVPVIVAINKIDKPEANVDHTKRMLMEQGIQLEEFGGDIQSVPVSALKGTNLDTLLEAIVLQAELMQLKGDPKGLVEGLVVESRTDPGRGKLCTAVIQRGTLKKGSVLLAGTAWAKVRTMFNERGQTLQEAMPSTPVEIIGWRSLPSAGEEILEVESERDAKEVVSWREHQSLQYKQKEDQVVIESKAEAHLNEYKAALEERRQAGRYKRRYLGPREKEIKEDDGLRVVLVIKGDVDGSVEAILDVLDTYQLHDQCKLDVVHYGVGMVTENDVEFAEAFRGIIYAFNVVIPENIKKMAKEKKVPIRLYNVIYRIIDDLKEEINKKLPAKDAEEFIGEAHVLQEFIINEGKKKVPVAGCRCTKGNLKKNALFRVKRGLDLTFDGTLTSMRHEKNEVDTIKKDVECGLKLSDPEVRFNPGDIIECYQIVQVPQKTQWDPGF